jgi:hypothetical protein
LVPSKIDPVTYEAVPSKLPVNPVVAKIEPVNVTILLS